MLNFNFFKSEIPTFDSSTSEYQIAVFVDQAVQLKRPSAILSNLLDERELFYKGRGSNEIFRIQGYIMASLEYHGLAKKALPIVLETLESSMSIYMVAASAKAIRGMGEPNFQVVPFLMSAINNVYHRDDTVSFSCYSPRWPLSDSTTALKEIFLTLQWLAPVAKDIIPKLEVWLQSDALNQDNKDLLIVTIKLIKETERKQEDCCDLYLQPPLFPKSISRKELLNVLLQDQDGQTLNYGAFFRNQPSILVFFYTRCDNHNKCSLTINKLGKLQKLIKEKGLSGKIKTAAISYDPAFDESKQLKLYGLQRHQEFDEFNRSFRVMNNEQMPMVLNYFSSSVNYFGRLVNKHQIELYLIDEYGYPIKKFVRLQWDPLVVVQELEFYLKQPKNKWRVTVQRISSTLVRTLLTLLIAFFPKCPICWAAYMSLLGIAGISSIPYTPLLLPMLCIFLTVHLWFLWRKSIKKKEWAAFYISLSGSILLIFFGAILHINKIMVLGIVLTIGGSLLSNLSSQAYSSMKSFIRMFFFHTQ